MFSLKDFIKKGLLNTEAQKETFKRKYDWNKMTAQDITIFNDFEVNFKFLSALEYVIPIACSKEDFFNDNVRNNFITKLIVWAYTYAKDIKYDASINPKCVYYGNIQRHEIYFLIMLYKMGFDVIYINPLKEELWNDIDDAGLSECIKSMEKLLAQWVK